MNRHGFLWLLPLCFACASVLYGHGHGAEISQNIGDKNKNNGHLATATSPVGSAGVNGGSNKGVVRVPKQVGSSPGGTVQNSKDHEQSGTHFDHHGHGHGHHGFTGHGHGLGHGSHGHYGDGKYFQYAHNPSYDEYEFGYRRGNDYHFQERYEKRGPYGWNFKTKVKWGDKYAGYGEQYYDYNHADKSYGHGGHDDGHGHGHHGGDEGHYSEQVPTVSKVPNKRQSQSGQEQIPSPNEGIEVNVKGEESQLPAFKPMRLRENKRVQLERERQLKMAIQQEREQLQREREQEQQQQVNPTSSGPMLTLNPVNGRVTDESTGKTYILKPAK